MRARYWAILFAALFALSLWCATPPVEEAPAWTSSARAEDFVVIDEGALNATPAPSAEPPASDETPPDAPSPTPFVLIVPTPTPLPAREPEPFMGYPPLTADGFLPEGEFVHEDPDAGVWVYLSPTLRVDIRRKETGSGKQQIVWLEADIRLGEGEAFRGFCASPDRPAKGKLRPEYIAQKHRVVYALNGDYFTYRVAKGRKAGLIIRDGQVVRTETYARTNGVLPPLDALALYPDGTMTFLPPSTYTAQEYLDMGATDVFSFGPILLAGGEVDPRLEVKGNRYRMSEPRSAIGQIGPRHFFGVYVEGRNNRSKGASLLFVANRMREAGCVDAIAMDGGQTAAMVFMGRTIMANTHYNGYTNTRAQSDIIGVGISEKVLTYQGR